MNINFSNMKTLFSKKSRHPKRPVVSPFRDWKIIIIVFVLINIATISFGIHTFYEMENGEITDLENSPRHVVSIDRGTLENVLNYYGAREVSLDILKTNGVSSVDPSR